LDANLSTISFDSRNGTASNTLAAKHANSACCAFGFGGTP